MAINSLRFCRTATKHDLHWFSTKVKPILERHVLTNFISMGPKLRKTAVISFTFLFHHASSLSYLPLHIANFPALCLILQGKICTYLIRLKTQAMTDKSRWLDKTFFITHPENMQWIAHIKWHIHKIFPCLFWAEKDQMSYALLKQCIHLYTSPNCQADASFTDLHPSASQWDQIHMLVYSDERLEIRTI